MCNSASFIIVISGEALYGKYHDSHELIIAENGLIDKEPVNFVRVEIAPPGENYKLPFKRWVYKRDQDIMPDWYNDKWGEKICREELKAWAKTHVYKTGTHYFDGGNLSLIFLDTAKAKITGMAGGDCRFYGSSRGTVSAQAGGDCRFYGSSRGTVKGIYGN